MSSWYWSWLPGLPSIDFALPSSIQSRFISFVLKKSLGHLLKPGQFDVHQIDSQIGSGYVQVKDLELNNEVYPSCLFSITKFFVLYMGCAGNQLYARWSPHYTP